MMELPVKQIYTHPDLQAREKMSERMIETLTERYRNDPSDVPYLMGFRDNENGGKFYLINGHHRLEAAKRAGVETVHVFLACGVNNFQDAVVSAMHINAENGTPLKNEDIRRAVEILLRYDPKRPIEDLCRILCRCKSTIYQYVKELSDAGKLELPKTRKGKDGKERPTKYADREPIEKPEKPEKPERPVKLERLEPLQRSIAERDDIGCFKNTVQCGNSQCQRMCSPVYLDELKEAEPEPGDWVFGNLNPEIAYCSEECRTLHEEQVLEKEADRILEASEPADFSNMETADQDSAGEEILPCPICGQMPNRCLDGSLTCWGRNDGKKFPPHEVAVKTSKNYSDVQVREIWNQLAKMKFQ